MTQSVVQVPQATVTPTLPPCTLIPLITLPRPLRTKITAMHSSILREIGFVFPKLIHEPAEADPWGGEGGTFGDSEDWALIIKS